MSQFTVELNKISFLTYNRSRVHSSSVGCSAKYTCRGIKGRIRRVGFLVGFPIFELGKK